MGCTQPEIPEQATWVLPQTHRCCHPGTRGIYPLLSVFLQTGPFGVQILWRMICCDVLVSGTGMHSRCKFIISYTILKWADMTSSSVQYVCSKFDSNCDRVLKTTWALWACEKIDRFSWFLLEIPACNKITNIPSIWRRVYIGYLSCQVI